jgi:hypothetical protein
VRKIFRQFQSATDHFPYHDIEKSHKGRTRGWRLEDDKASILSDMILAAKKYMKIFFSPQMVEN